MVRIPGRTWVCRIDCRTVSRRWKPIFEQDEADISQVLLDELINSRDELQQALNRANRQSQQLAVGVAEASGQALVVATEDPAVKMLAAKLRKALDEYKEHSNLEEISQVDDLELRLTEATLANAERRYARSLELITEDDALGEQLTTEVQIQREVSVQRVRGDATYGQASWAEALECYTRINQLRPDNIDALNSMARCNWDLARYDVAREQLLRCIEKQESETDRAPYYSNLALVEQDLGNLSEARAFAKGDRDQRAGVRGGPSCPCGQRLQPGDGRARTGESERGASARAAGLLDRQGEVR